MHSSQGAQGDKRGGHVNQLAQKGVLISKIPTFLAIMLLSELNSQISLIVQVQFNSFNKHSFFFFFSIGVPQWPLLKYHKLNMLPL